MAWPSNDQRQTETERVRGCCCTQGQSCCTLCHRQPCRVCIALQLFGESVPSVPLSSNAPALQQPAIQPHQQPLQQHTVVLSAAPPAALEGGYWQENTLDESVWQTLKRDVLTIGRNLRSVLIPVNWDFHNHTAALQNWDLWGPLVSAHDHQSRSCSAGSVVLRRNARTTMHGRSA